MSSLALLTYVLDSYVEAKSQPFKAHPLQKVVNRDLPSALIEHLRLDERYKVRGSVGMAQWAHCPWVAILDRVVTETPQVGYYFVISFRADMSGFYLSLNQGITFLKEEFGRKAADVLLLRGQHFATILGKPPANFMTGKISIGAPSGTDAQLFDYGNIWSKFYSRKNLPTEEQMFSEITLLLEAYRKLVEHDREQGFEHHDEASDLSIAEEKLFYEEGRRRIYHSRIERSAALAKQAKKIHGSKCQVCNFDFMKAYGEIGKNYIEAHHLTPLSKLSGPVMLNAKRDFAVLCSNCHRMVHRLEGEENPLEILKTFLKFG